MASPEPAILPPAASERRLATVRKLLSAARPGRLDAVLAGTAARVYGV